MSQKGQKDRQTSQWTDKKCIIRDSEKEIVKEDMIILLTAIEYSKC